MPAPKVISLSEVTALGPNRQVVKQVLVKYSVGDDGPFTLTTTQADIANGNALQQMNTFAASLAQLPR